MLRVHSFWGLARRRRSLVQERLNLGMGLVLAARYQLLRRLPRINMHVFTGEMTNE
jgi:hypothetical protein